MLLLVFPAQPVSNTRLTRTRWLTFQVDFFLSRVTMCSTYPENLYKSSVISSITRQQDVRRTASNGSPRNSPLVASSLPSFHAEPTTETPDDAHHGIRVGQ